MLLTDSHAHLDDSRFDTDRDDVLLRAWDAGVRRILTIGNGRGPDDMGCGIPIAEKHDWIVTSVGVHPHEAAQVEERHYDQMLRLAQHPKVVAIGEAGLDYHYDLSPRETQREVFRRQLRMARETAKPIIVHTREADEDTARILQEEMPLRGVLHCFTSGPGLAEAALQMGFTISFSGIVTFAKSAELAELAARVPQDRLMIETDCPYLAPVPHRGKRNEPSFLAATGRLVASRRGLDDNQFAGITSANFQQLFGG